MLHGALHPNAKLTSAQVNEIKVRLADGEMKTAIAADYGISDATVYDIGKGRRWKHLSQKVEQP